MEKLQASIGNRPLQYCFMPQLLNGKDRPHPRFVANRWSLAFAIAQGLCAGGPPRSFSRYQGERQQRDSRGLGQGIRRGWRSSPATCPRTRNSAAPGRQKLTADGLTPGTPVVHSIAFANREDLSGRFLDTSRTGLRPLAQERQRPTRWVAVGAKQ